MKKAIVLLLALAVLGGAVFAQDEEPALTTAVALFGEFGVYNNGTDSFVDGNVGVDVDFDYDGDVFGLSVELEAVNPDYYGNGNGVFNISYAYGWAKFFDGMVKLDFGNMFIGSYRLRNSMLNVLGGGGIIYEGAAIEVFPIEGLSFAIGMPIGFTKDFLSGAPAYAVEAGDFAKELDFFAKYAMADVGTFYASFQMADADSLFNIAADLKMVPNATIQLGYNMSGIGGTADPVNKIYFVGGYKMDALSFGEEVNLTLGDDLLWLSNTYGYYRMGDVRFGITARVWNAITPSDYINYRINPTVRLYSGTNTLTLGFRFDGSTLDGAKATWQLPVAWSFYY